MFLPNEGAGLLAAGGHGRDSGRHHAIAAHRHRLRARTHARHQHAAAAAGGQRVLRTRFTVLVLKRSILTEKVARRGYHLSREYAVDPLEILFARRRDANQPGGFVGREHLGAGAVNPEHQSRAAWPASVSGSRRRPPAARRRSPGTTCGNGWKIRILPAKPWPSLVHDARDRSSRRAVARGCVTAWPKPG